MTETESIRNHIQALCIAQLCNATVRSEIDVKGVQVRIDFHDLGRCKICVTWAMLEEWEDVQLRYWLRDELSKTVEYLAMRKWLK